MDHFKVYNEINAPEGSQSTLAATKSALGFVPNLFGTMAAAPSVLKAYTQLSDLLSNSSLSTQEQHLLTLAISEENNCEYCVAAEGLISNKMAGVPIETVKAVQEGKPVQDPKLEAFLSFARDMVANKGFPTKESTTAFLDAGYTQENALEIILGISLKVLSNYTNHIAAIPIDDAFLNFAIEPEQAA